MPSETHIIETAKPESERIEYDREIDRRLSFARGSRIAEDFEIDWNRAERRQSAFTRGFTKIPNQIKA